MIRHYSNRLFRRLWLGPRYSSQNCYDLQLGSSFLAFLFRFAVRFETSRVSGNICDELLAWGKEMGPGCGGIQVPVFQTFSSIGRCLIVVNDNSRQASRKPTRKLPVKLPVKLPWKLTG